MQEIQVVANSEIGIAAINHEEFALTDDPSFMVMPFDEFYDLLDVEFDGTIGTVCDEIEIAILENEYGVTY